MSAADPNAPVSTIPGVTGKGTEVATVTITIQRTPALGKTLEPPPEMPVEMSFVHQDLDHGGPPTHKRPHGILWNVVGLEKDERVEIQLDSCFPGFAQMPKHGQPWWEHLKRLFPYAGPLPRSGAFGFEITKDAPTALSGRAVLPDRFELKLHKQKKRPLLSYQIVFFDKDDRPHEIDPDVDVEPDP